MPVCVSLALVRRLLLQLRLRLCLERLLLLLRLLRLLRLLLLLVMVLLWLLRLHRVPRRDLLL